MELPNEIVLRPRFTLALNQLNETALKAFEAAKENQSEFVISRSDDHIFIRITKQKQHFWSPQLHLEIISLEEQKSFLQGFFSPNPTVWTMFMFFHFVVAILFLGFSIWTYTNYTLHSSFALQLAGMFFMVLIWIGLYFGGRMGKLAGKKEMHAQYDFMKKTLEMS